MQLDLTKSRPALAAWITEAMPKVAEAPERKDAPVTRLDLSFDLTSMEVPVIYFGFSTHPNGDPGRVHWVADHGRPDWERACAQAFSGKEVAVVSPAGNAAVSDEESLCAAVGAFLVALLKALRDDGAFYGLPVAERCYLGVASHDGTYAWPRYEDRGPDNML